MLGALKFLQGLSLAMACDCVLLTWWRLLAKVGLYLVGMDGKNFTGGWHCGQPLGSMLQSWEVVLTFCWLGLFLIGAWTVHYVLRQVC